MATPSHDRAPGRRAKWACRCGFRFLAAPLIIAPNQPRITGFFAAEHCWPVRAGQRITSCPRCRRDLPGMPWEVFQDQHLAGGFGP